MKGTGKHFPGYTFCGIDPHGDLPLVSRTREEIEKEELAVFREVGGHCDAIMVGHAQFPAWGAGSGPASLNREIVTDLLKKKMGYRGLVMTDDLEMGAIYYDIYDQALKGMNQFKISEMFWYRDPRYTKDLYLVPTDDLIHYLLNKEEYDTSKNISFSHVNPYERDYDELDHFFKKGYKPCSSWYEKMVKKT